MQSRDGLTDDITPQYRDRIIAEDLPTPFSAGRRALAIAAARLVPGAGHMTLGSFALFQQAQDRHAAEFMDELLVAAATDSR